jgi:isocitrate dehydrogenase
MKNENVFLWDGKINIPKDGELIKLKSDHSIEVPDNPIIPFISGDGIGPEITPVMLNVVNAAMEKAYGDEKKIYWVEAIAGDKAESNGLERMPAETLELLKRSVVSIKGPLGTPVGKPGKSLNSILRQSMDFYSAIRPVYYLGQPTPIPDPERVDVTIFRENSDDVYMAIEYMAGSEGAKKVRNFFLNEMGVKDAAIPEDAGITIKPMSEFKTKRHVRKAFRYAIDNGKKSIAVAGKGNIMKATEGAFLNWAFEAAKEDEFKDKISTEAGSSPEKIKLSKVITDQMLMQLVLNPNAYDVIITQNLNGDYISDLASALVGGPGFVPSGNIGDGYALFESTHGVGMDIAGKGIANPLSITLSGAMMLEYIGFNEAAKLVYDAVKRTIYQGNGTRDIYTGFEKLDKKAVELSTVEFGKHIIKEI